MVKLKHSQPIIIRFYMLPNFVFVKNDVSICEYKIHTYALGLDLPCPRIYGYDPDKKTMHMQRLPGMSVADMYGENPDEVPEWIFENIRTILKTLYVNNVEYPDITGYNFMVHENKIYILDFGHAVVHDSLPTNEFMLKFINGHNGWNPEFK